MVKFSTNSAEYERYGLDDSRCGDERPIGFIQLIIGSSEWMVITEALESKFTGQTKWAFQHPLYVRRLHDRFLVHFTYNFSLKDVYRPGIMLLVPFTVLTSAETEVLNKLSEKRHARNIEGDFYGISNECGCIQACTPLEIAPDLIGHQLEPEGCYFTKQPQTTDELKLAIEAVLNAFTHNLRYAGDDPNILRSIRTATRNPMLDFCQDDLCDYPTNGID